MTNFKNEKWLGREFIKLYWRKKPLNANYLLTGKVIIEWKDLFQKRNKEESDKLIKKLGIKGIC